jgi:hypothetical protein
MRRKRREELLRWLRMPHNGRAYTVRELVEHTALYDGLSLTGGLASCRADLRYLWLRGQVCRWDGPDSEGRPHRWATI